MDDTPTETGEIIMSWLKEEYKAYTWTMVRSTVEDKGKAATLETLEANVNGVRIQLRLVNLDVTIYMKTPRGGYQRTRSVTLSHPDSIAGLQEVVRHVIKVTDSPFAR